MNLDTVRKCAEIAAAARAASIGIVDADIVELLEQLDAAQASAAEEPPAAKPKKAKAAE